MLKLTPQFFSVLTGYFPFFLKVSDYFFSLRLSVTSTYEIYCLGVEMTQLIRHFHPGLLLTTLFSFYLRLVAFNDLGFCFVWALSQGIYGNLDFSIFQLFV